jgi:hypothetical protein
MFEDKRITKIFYTKEALARVLSELNGVIEAPGSSPESQMEAFVKNSQKNAPKGTRREKPWLALYCYLSYLALEGPEEAKIFEWKPEFIVHANANRRPDEMSLKNPSEIFQKALREYSTGGPTVP